MVNKNLKINRKNVEVKSFEVKSGRRWKGCLSFSFQRQPSMEHSKGHQTWNLLLATKQKCFLINLQAWFISRATKHGTFQGPLTLEPSIGHQIGGFLSPLSFLFFLKVKIWINCCFFLGTWFSIWIFDNLFLQLFLGGEEWLILVDGGNRDNRLDHSSTLEKMEMTRGRFGAWNLIEFS